MFVIISEDKSQKLKKKNIYVYIPQETKYFQHFKV